MDAVPVVSLVLRHDGKFAGNRIHVLGRMEVVPPRLSQRGRGGMMLAGIAVAATVVLIILAVNI